MCPGIHYARFIISAEMFFPGMFLTGFNREQSDLDFGLRTFPLVAVVTCGFILVGIDVIDSTDGEARIIQGIITGIGFIGVAPLSPPRTR